MNEQCMVAISFRGCTKGEAKALMAGAGLKVFERPDGVKGDVIVLDRYVFEDHPQDHIKFLFSRIGVWDITYTGWKLWAWIERFGPVN